jgi:heme-degrading monooxygenase HmoA
MQRDGVIATVDDSQAPNDGGDPMAVLFAEYKVEDAERFRTVFTGFELVRREFGASGHRVLMSPDDPTVVAIMIEFDSVDAARRFCDEPRRIEALERAGVIGRADQVFDELEDVGY